MSDLPDASEPGGTVTNTCAQCGRIYDPAKPHDCADRTAFTHGLELLDDPAVLARADDVRDAITAARPTPNTA